MSDLDDLLGEPTEAEVDLVEAELDEELGIVDEDPVKKPAPKKSGKKKKATKEVTAEPVTGNPQPGEPGYVNRMPRRGSRRGKPQDEPRPGGRRYYDPPAEEGDEE